MSDKGKDRRTRFGTLRHFEGIWPTELAAIDKRRRRHDREGVRRNRSERGDDSENRFPNPRKIFSDRGFVPPDPSAENGDPDKPDRDKMRPQPVPCDATGLALSGGGIRSAAVCLGVLQALSKNKRLGAIDYLSTVSGGGYIGACLSAAMCGVNDFPFGDDIRDNDAIAHLRNYSNYLMPRGRSNLRNGLEAGLLILRGLLANVVIVAAWLLGAVVLTWLVYPPAGTPASTILFAPMVLAALLGIHLLIWTVLRSFGERRLSNDTGGLMLQSGYILSIVTLLVTLICLQPFMVLAFLWLSQNHGDVLAYLKNIAAALTTFAVAVSACASALGHFLNKSERATALSATTLRLITQGMILLAACVLPLAIYFTYLWLTATSVGGWDVPGWVLSSVDWLLTIRWLPAWFTSSSWTALPRFLLVAAVIATLVGLPFGPNSYSLHRFYRDRLSKAFLFQSKPPLVACDDLKLSTLDGGHAPYHIVNAAMNVQGSAEANRRGRNADFFIFTPDFVGSDLTLYGPTRAVAGLAATTAMEKVDPQLDLGTAMAISGAAVSANAGANTVRALSPSLALLNVRLGYWLKNPLVLARAADLPRKLKYWLWAKFYLAEEMLNLLSENSPLVYLTDGGHIENLGLYELLKRGCQAIIVVDAEADPQMAFPSLLKVERFARIDLGVRIQLPWEDIASYTCWASAQVVANQPIYGQGPHCAVGRIFYADGAQGVLLYFKSSFTGDEKDYIVDYKRRNSQFPHETTGDQFFTEEQFEMYRALGFHMADGFFTQTHVFRFLSEAEGGFADDASAFAEVDGLIPQR